MRPKRSRAESRHQPTLEQMASLPAQERRSLRSAVQKVFSDSKPADFPEDAIIDAADVEMHVPMHIGDYTDFCIA